MSDVTMTFTIMGDSEGFVTFKCPFCKSEFKLAAGEFQNEENPFNELFCPYCGLIDKANSFYSQEVIEHVQNLAKNYMIEQINKSFGNMARDLNRSNSIKMDFKPLKTVNLKELKDKDTVEQNFECSSCNTHVKVLYCSGISKVFCPYCGVDV